jgi:hypothetical protein
MQPRVLYRRQHQHLALTLRRSCSSAAPTTRFGVVGLATVLGQLARRCQVRRASTASSAGQGGAPG